MTATKKKAHKGTVKNIRVADTRVETTEKTKQIINIAIETTLKIWQKTRQQKDVFLHQQGALFDKEQESHSKYKKNTTTTKNNRYKKKHK